MTLLRILIVCFALLAIGAAESESEWVPVRVVGIDYPVLARQSRTAGIVRVQCDIASDGSVAKATITSGSLLLGSSILEGIGDWRFQKAPSTVRPRSNRVTLTVTFILRDATTMHTKTQFVYDYPYNVTVVSTPVYRSH